MSVRPPQTVTAWRCPWCRACQSTSPNGSFPYNNLRIDGCWCKRLYIHYTLINFRCVGGKNYTYPLRVSMFSYQQWVLAILKLRDVWVGWWEKTSMVWRYRAAWIWSNGIVALLMNSHWRSVCLVCWSVVVLELFAIVCEQILANQGK